MQVGLAVGKADGFAVDLVQPVVGSDLAGHVEHQPTERITLIGIGLDPPVFTVEVFIHRRGNLDQGFAVAAQASVLFAVDDVGA
ncbi:hypothetical protein D3C79_820480 [compost metagenome]